MLSPSWPTAAQRHRARPRGPVRRRAERAQRRAMRVSTALGGAVVALIVAADVAQNLATGSPGARLMAHVQLVVMLFAALVGATVLRAKVRPEPAAAALLAAVYAMTLGLLVAMPDDRLLTTAQLAMILIGSGLFLPWSPAWHASWLAIAAALGGSALLLPGSEALLGVPPGQLALVIGMSTLTSGIGHALWQGRMRRMLEQQYELRWLSTHAKAQEAHVSELNRQLSRVARLDTLTSVGNRLALDEALARVTDQGDRLRPPHFALVLLDLDHFKRFNDEHGHLAGDAALARVGEILRRETREADLVFRYGGEEFLVLLPEADLQAALAVAERVRGAVEADVDPSRRMTVSAGVALHDPADGRDPEPLLRRADAALYLAKRAGRNRVAADELSTAMARRGIAPVA